MLTCGAWYAADRGTITLDVLEYSVDGHVQGALTGAHLVEVDWSSGSPVPDGLGYCIDRWDFDATLNWDIP